VVVAGAAALLARGLGPVRSAARSPCVTAAAAMVAGALALGPPAAADRLTILTAVVSLLAQAGHERPLLLVVDDAPWLDEPSQEALGFVARRATGLPVAVLVALRHPHGEEARRYNVLQNVAYLSLVFIVLPLIVVCGWAMSPLLDGVGTGWVDWLGGRQSARTLHFIGAVLLVAFVVVHLFEVVVTGLANNLRSMLTGYWRIPE